MLKKGRADTLKEAINLMFDEKRKFQEAAIQREILEEQARDNYLHNRKMELEAEEMARAAQRQADAARSQAAAVQAQSDYLQKTIEAQCKLCKKRFCCPFGKNRPMSCREYEHY